MCDTWADCSCGDGCQCGPSCKCGTVSHDFLNSVKASSCKFKTCSCGPSCRCGADCTCAEGELRSGSDWISHAKSKLDSDKKACACKTGGTCLCGPSCQCAAA